LAPYIGYNVNRPKILSIAANTIPAKIYKDNPITITSTSSFDSSVSISKNIILDVSAMNPTGLDIYGDLMPTGSSNSGRIVYSGILNNANAVTDLAT
jgi:hypothetical protein